MQQRSFCYDALDRLQYAATGSSGPASCTSGAITKSVAYDALGNITAKSDVGSYGYPAPGSALPHAVSSIAGTVNGVVNPTYGYDADGNLTSGAGRTVTYTPFNRTASIVQGAIADCLAYDSDHARIRMERRAAACAGTLGSATYYLNDPVSGAMSEKMVAGSTVTWTDYLTAGGRLIAQRTAPSGGTPAAWGGFAWGAGTWSATASTWTYFTLDQLGSVAVLTDGTGAVSERDSYDAWGRRRNSDGTDNPSCSITSATTRGFTGHEMLDTVCQVNANARLYDPTIARFMSPDSMVSDPFDGQSFNRYSYVENGPLSATDPTGYVNSGIVLPSKPPILSELAPGDAIAEDNVGDTLEHVPVIGDRNWPDWSMIEFEVSQMLQEFIRSEADSDTETVVVIGFRPKESKPSPQPVTLPATDTNGVLDWPGRKMCELGSLSGTKLNLPFSDSRLAPDYYNLTATLPLPFAPNIGIGASISLDKYGNVYVGPVVGAGYPTGASLSGSVGYMLQMSNPSPAQLSSLLSQWSVTAGGNTPYYGLGGGVSGNDSGIGVHAGVGLPGAGVQGSYSHHC